MCRYRASIVDGAVRVPEAGTLHVSSVGGWVVGKALLPGHIGKGVMKVACGTHMAQQVEVEANLSATSQEGGIFLTCSWHIAHRVTFTFESGCAMAGRFHFICN